MSTDLDRLAQDLGRFGVSGADDQPFVAGRVTVTSAPTSAAEVAAFLGREGVVGWAMTADGNWCRRAGTAWDGLPDRRCGASPAEGSAAVLAAEVVLAEGDSLHVRRVGDSLHTWRFSERGDGTAVLWRATRRASTAPHTRYLGYRVAWRPVEITHDDIAVPVLRPWLARFVGWHE